MLIGVPVPPEYDLNKQEMEAVIEEGLRKARIANISGKEITPFLLANVVEATSGKSLQTSILIARSAKLS